MVTWAGDGTLAGFEPFTRRLENGLYKFASPGAVDLGGITRMQFDVAGLPNRLRMTAPFTFTTTDIPVPDPNGPFFPTGWGFWGGFSAAAFLTPASAFAEGVTPTIEQIVYAPVARVFRADYYVTSAQTRTFNIAGPGPYDMTAGQKYWVAIVPTRLSDPESQWSIQNDVPLPGFNLNASGRALSFWTNRRPSPPIITSPAPKSAVVAGNTFTLTIDTVDADRQAPDDAARAGRDLAGIQVQYAPAPRIGQPDAYMWWKPLPYSNPSGVVVDSDYVIGQIAPSATDAMVRNLGFTVLCGSDEAPPGQAYLPGGDWQIRVRVADYGSPYPLDVNSPNNSSPGVWSMDNYPEFNKSEWSTPVLVSIPSQVPPPVPLVPIASIAVPETSGVQFAWQYRNTHNPPFAQARRAVQVRKVGDTDYKTIVGDMSASASVTVPLVVDNPPPTPPTQYFSDIGFESGTIGGWSIFPGQPGGPITNVAAAASGSGSHSGARHMQLAYAADAGLPGVYYASAQRKYLVSALNASHSQFDMSMWVGVDTHAYAVLVQFYWAGPDGLNYMTEDGDLDPRYVRQVVNAQTDGNWATSKWLNITVEPMDRPSDASALFVAVQYISENDLGKGRVDDTSLIGSNPFSLDDFTFSATNEYEWRVRSQDTDGVLSTYSDPARFWMVPAPDTGIERPVPTQTVDGATLGFGTHRIEVYRRGGLRPTGEIKNVSSVEWSRVRDDISEAKIEVSGWDIDGGNLLSKLQCWAYEIVIFRDNGFSVDRVWEGPISLLTYEQDKVTIQAKDVMAYPYRRIIKQAMKGLATDTVVTRAVSVLQNVLAPDDPNVLAYIKVLQRQDDTTAQYRSIPAYSRTAFEEIDDMAANTGLDYTVVGRSVIFWGTRNRIGLLPEFTDKDLGAAPIVSEYGMNMANFYAISDGNGVFGSANRLGVSGNDPIYGLVEMLSSTWADDTPEESGTYTQVDQQKTIAKFAAGADRSIQDRYLPGSPVVVRVPDNTTLNPSLVLSIQNLVPGVAIPLRSTGTLRTVKATQKLDSIKVTEKAGVETISITMSPFSREDANAEEEAPA